MPRSYDLVVLGAGTAAMTAASRVRDQGWSVAVIDFRPFGGTCALRGCDPKKMLIGGTSAVDHARRMRGKGVAGDARIDWSELMAFKRSFTDPVPELHERNYKSKGIDTFHGKARFTGRQTIEVAGEVLDARYVLLATGAEPVKLGIPGEEHLVTNEQFLSLEALPARIAFVGGGYIAAEFAHIAALSGAKVTVLQHGPRMLKAFDKDLVGWLMAKFQALGIDVRTGTSVERVDQPAHEFRVWTSRDGQKQSIEADLVVHAAGRAPDFSGLNLEAAGVEVDGGRLKLNEFLQSVSNPAVYAAGDAAQVGPPLTPVSSHDAHIVAANMLKGNARRPDYRGVPSVAFTVPPSPADTVLRLSMKGCNDAPCGGFTLAQLLARAGRDADAAKVLDRWLPSGGRVLIGPGAMILRAQIAERLGDGAGAQLWYQRVLARWGAGGAEVQSMLSLAREGAKRTARKG